MSLEVATGVVAILNGLILLRVWRIGQEIKENSRRAEAARARIDAAIGRMDAASERMNAASERMEMLRRPR